MWLRWEIPEDYKLERFGQSELGSMVQCLPECFARRKQTLRLYSNDDLVAYSHFNNGTFWLGLRGFVFQSEGVAEASITEKWHYIQMMDAFWRAAASLHVRGRYSASY